MLEGLDDAVGGALEELEALVGEVGTATTGPECVELRAACVKVAGRESDII